jgi:GT2 family glycosyltransferase
MKAAVRDLRAGLAALARHLRNSRGRPDRLMWIGRRIVQLAAAGRVRAVLERHAIVDDLYADYAEWLRQYDRVDDVEHSRSAARMAAAPAGASITVLIPTYESHVEWLREAVQSVRSQVYLPTELLVVDDGSRDPALREYLQQLAREPGTRVHYRDRNGGISECLDTGLSLVATDYVAFLDHDDLLHPLALLRVAEALQRRPDAALLYTDEDRIDAAGRRSSPHFKPDWNEEWIRTINYVLHLCVARTSTAREAGGFGGCHDGVQDWELVLRIRELAGAHRIIHVPHVLYHWRITPGSTAAGVYHKQHVETAQRIAMEEMLRRRGLRGTVERALHGWRIRYAVPEPTPLVSIVVLTRDHSDLLRTCLTSVLERTRYPNFEVVIVDHASSEAGAVALLEQLQSDARVRIVGYAGRFNYAAQCNLGARHARGSCLVFLNNDVRVLQADWLDELAAHAAQRDVGVVGVQLLYPNGTIQHAGVIVGLNGTADRPYVGYRRGHAGVAGRAQAAQDVTAVVTACAAVRTSVFNEIGSFDESLAVSLNDVDLCLRAIAAGYRNVLTPYVEMIHAEGGSRGLEIAPDELARAAREAEIFASRWQAQILADPTYNPNLTLSGKAYALAWPPRPATTR